MQHQRSQGGYEWGERCRSPVLRVSEEDGGASGVAVSSRLGGEARLADRPRPVEHREGHAGARPGRERLGEEVLLALSADEHGRPGPGHARRKLPSCPAVVRVRGGTQQGGVRLPQPSTREAPELVAQTLAQMLVRRQRGGLLAASGEDVHQEADGAFLQRGLLDECGRRSFRTGEPGSAKSQAGGDDDGQRLCAQRGQPLALGERPGVGESGEELAIE